MYVFSGGDATPDDIDRDKGDPISTALVDEDLASSTGFSYRADFLPPGDYTVAFVCADADDPDEDDALDFTLVPGAVPVVDNQTTEVDIQAP